MAVYLSKMAATMVGTNIVPAICFFVFVFGFVFVCFLFCFLFLFLGTDTPINECLPLNRCLQAVLEFRVHYQTKGGHQHV